MTIQCRMGEFLGCLHAHCTSIIMTIVQCSMQSGEPCQQPNTVTFELLHADYIDCIG